MLRYPARVPCSAVAGRRGLLAFSRGLPAWVFRHRRGRREVLPENANLAGCAFHVSSCRLDRRTNSSRSRSCSRRRRAEPQRLPGRGLYGSRIPLGALFACIVAGFAWRSSLNALYRDVEHRATGAPAVVLPHADPLQPQRPPGVDKCQRPFPPPLDNFRTATRGCGLCLLRRSTRGRGRSTAVAAVVALSGAGLQPLRRPDRDRS
jgi:hypothetical protein